MNRIRNTWRSLTVPVALIATVTLRAPEASAQQATGPYLGLEGGLNWQDPQDWTQGRPVIDRLHFKDGWIAGVNAGYALSSGLRPELELDHRRNTFNHDAFGVTHGSSTADSALMNLWYDLRVSSGPFSYFHPYIGGGAGAVRSYYRDANLAGVPIAGEYSTEFAYQAGAGLAVDVSPHMTVSLDYRRLWSNRGRFHDNPGGVVPGVGPYDHNYLGETAMLGLRYSFGSISPPPTPTAAVAPVPPPTPAPEAPTPPPPPPVAAAPPPCQPPAGFQVDAQCHIIDQTVIVRAVDFEFGSARLTLPAQQSLDGLAQSLIGQEGLRLEVQGYTDSVGSDAANLRLSQHRADAARTYLLDKGIEASRLTARGYGNTSPIESNSTPEGRALNRRVAFQVTHAPAHVIVDNRGATAESTEAAQARDTRHVRHPRQGTPSAPAVTPKSVGP